MRRLRGHWNCRDCSFYMKCTVEGSDITPWQELKKKLQLEYAYGDHSENDHRVTFHTEEVD